MKRLALAFLLLPSISSAASFHENRYDYHLMAGLTFGVVWDGWGYKLEAPPHSPLERVLSATFMGASLGLWKEVGDMATGHPMDSEDVRWTATGALGGALVTELFRWHPWKPRL